MLLALETACDPGGIALAERGVVVAERVFGEREQPGGVLLPVLEALLAEAGTELAALDAIALSIGPGSFTGLRVGLASVLGLTFARPIPVVPVPTLAALSLESTADAIVPLLDARKGQIYAGLYGPDAECLLADRVSDPEPWFRTLAERPGRFALLGSGLARHADAARAVLGARAELLELRGGPRPASVARLGARLLRRGGALPAGEIRLRYLRPPEAERLRATPA